MRLLLLDNYDSFTYNLFHLLEQYSGVVDVIRNDELKLEAVAAYDGIVLSPGPGLPKDAGVMPALIAAYATEKPILGICLGHQAIAEAFGAKLSNLPEVMHGIANEIEVLDPSEELFQGLPGKFMAGHYHSWSVDKSGFPDILQLTAKDEKGNIMGLRHRSLPVHGLQFHPESVLTPFGERIVGNWIKLITRDELRIMS